MTASTTLTIPKHHLNHLIHRLRMCEMVKVVEVYLKVIGGTITIVRLRIGVVDIEDIEIWLLS